MSEYDTELRSICGDAEQGGHRQTSRDGSGDGSPELSEADQRHFDNGGSVSETDFEQLRRDYGFSQPQEREEYVSPKVRDLFNRVVAHANNETLRAERLDERNQMLREAFTQEQPQPEQGHAWSRPQERPDPNEDILRRRSTTINAWLASSG
jgi:hypothetical protein